ncbi:MAG: DUF3817 domain-containing protein [Nocardioidaceae bacterium]
MASLVRWYRPLALIVGVLLLVATIGSLCKYLLTEGSSPQRFGENLAFLWPIHGWFYIAYFVVAILLARKAGWSIPYTLVMLAAGLVPVLMFFVEHKVMQRVRSEHPALAPQP